VKKGKQGFGWGDAKFAFLIGLILGLPLTLVSLMTAVFAGAFLGGILLLLSKGRYRKMPFVPYMSFGCLVAGVCGDNIWQLVKNLVLI
jgi:prepilin signal peptidase PulO-like enzyme (type II secretory pathway)